VKILKDQAKKELAVVINLCWNKKPSFGLSEKPI